uniref:Lysosome membrane protein 2-like n=1 Tax=Sinocyclocheilus anshuiensis TaxID=1608454 RepID=A0A671L767_9TELE
MTRRSCAIYATGIVCAHLLILGIALLVAQVFQTMIQERIKKEITLAENSRVLEGWINPPPPVYMQYFFFSVTNSDEFLAGKEKPKVTQIGPYTYREYRPRENVTFLENGTKIFATNPKSFVFLRNMSSGDPEVDRVITVNIPFIAVMNELNSYSFFLRSAVSMWMGSMGIEVFMNRTVHEVLWGFKDPLLSKLHAMRPEVDEHFGLMYNKNGTHEGEFVFHTGEKNYMDYGKIDTWNGIRYLTAFDPYPNKYNFTDGSVFHTFLSRKELLYIFAADLCRSIHLAYVADKEVKGIPAFRFAPPSDVLAPPDENPSNAGFCVPAGDCLGKGVLKVSVCRQGAPIVVSFPHFYQADKRYINAIDGMNPNEEEHETYLDINPTTGVPIRALKTSHKTTKECSGVKKMETATIDDESAARMRTLLLIVTVMSNFPVIIVGLGAILLVVLIFLICRNRQRKNEVKRIDFTEAFHSFATTKDETAYTQVSNQAEDSPENRTNQPLRNGSYIAMSPVEAQKC